MMYKASVNIFENKRIYPEGQSSSFLTPLTTHYTRKKHNNNNDNNTLIIT